MRDVSGGFPFASLLSFRPCNYSEILTMMTGMMMKMSITLEEIKDSEYHMFTKMYDILIEAFSPKN